MTLYINANLSCNKYSFWIGLLILRQDVLNFSNDLDGSQIPLKIFIADL